MSRTGWEGGGGGWVGLDRKKNQAFLMAMDLAFGVVFTSAISNTHHWTFTVLQFSVHIFVFF